MSDEWDSLPALDIAKAMENAVANGTINDVRKIYQKWQSAQRTNPVPGVTVLDCFYHAAYLAATMGHAEILSYLLSEGVEFDLVLVKGAVLAKNIDVLEILLGHGWNINEPESFSDPPYLGLAVHDEQLVQWFLDHGADPNKTAREWDITPLTFAVNQASLKIIKTLFQHGGNIDHGQLLHFACYRTDGESISIINFLLDQGAPLNNYLWEDKPQLADWSALGATTPLFNAAEVGNIDAVTLLLEKGADQSKGSVSTKRLPIDAAAACNHTDIVTLLSVQKTG